MDLKSKYELWITRYKCYTDPNYKSVTVYWPSRKEPMVEVTIGPNSINEYVISIKYIHLLDDEFTFKEEEIEIFHKILQELKETNHDS
jgi:hypothetical protein